MQKTYELADLAEDCFASIDAKPWAYFRLDALISLTNFSLLPY